MKGKSEHIKIYSPKCKHFAEISSKSHNDISYDCLSCLLK